MGTFHTTIPLLAHSLAWALLCSLWQGLLIHGSVFILLKALPGINARAKYNLSLAGLFSILLWFVDTWSSQFQKLKGVTVYVTRSEADALAATTYPVKVFAINEQLHQPVIGYSIQFLAHYFPAIITVYIIGLAFMLFRFLMNIVQLRALKTKGITQPEAKWNELLLQLQQRLDIARHVHLLFSTRINVPMMLGAVKPVILLPIAVINHLATEEVEAILLHELAHIKRHDYLLNIFQTIAETILFFNPFVWLVSGIARREREHRCDDLVIAATASPIHYARALANIESHQLAANRLTIAATGHKKQLFHRIKRIMEMKKSNINYSRLTIAIVAIIAITCTIAMFTFTPSLAQKAKSDSVDTTTKKKSVYKYRSVTVDSNGKETVEEHVSDKPVKGKMHDKEKDGDEENTEANVSIDDGDVKDMKNKIYEEVMNDSNGLRKIIAEISISSKDASSNALASIDFDKLGREMDQAGKEMDEAGKEMARIDFDKMNKELAASQKKLARIDFKKINKEMEAAGKEIDAIDWDRISKDIAQATKELSDPKMQKEISVEIRKEMEKTKDALEDTKRQIRQQRREMSLEARANTEDHDTHAGNNDLETMLRKMDHDGLIDRSGNYKIEKEDGELYINGDKQPSEVYNKYHRYLKDRSVNIKGHNGTIKVKMNN